MNTLLQLFLICLLAFSMTVQATSRPTAQKQLKNIEKKIARLSKVQQTDIEERIALENELRAIDLSISELTAQLNDIDQTILHDEQLLEEIKNSHLALTQTLQKQQHLLRSHLLIQYHIANKDPVTIILNKKDPSLRKRLGIYLKAIQKERLTLLSNIHKTRVQLSENEQALKSNLSDLSQKKEAHKKTTQSLQVDQQLQSEIILTLNSQIKGRAQRLMHLNQNKKNLQAVIKNIEIKTIKKNMATPIRSLKRKLPWPVKGKVFHSSYYGRRSKGIYIRATEGTKVRAIHAGKVVFSNWLNGYGLITIVQHDQSALSLYANNQQLLKRKGDFVDKLEPIAIVGHSGGQKTDGLYFEIRYKDQVVPALSWLTS